MDSKELNRRIREIDESDDPPYICFGGKVIPYIGAFWRDVDFDAECAVFGIIPQDLDDDVPLVGFMENNKWGYESYIVKGETWQNIKRLIEKAVKEPTYENWKAVDEAIQSTLPKNMINQK